MYDASLGYDNAIDTTTEKGLLNALSWFGITTLIRSSNLFKDSRFSKIIFNQYVVDTYSEILTDPDNLSGICHKAAHSGIDLYRHPIWNKFLDTQFEAGLKNDNIIYQALRNSDNYMNYLLHWKKDVDWMEIYNLYFEKQKFHSYVTVPFVNTLNKYFEHNPICARISIEADLFEAESKPDSNVRTEMYIAYIKSGFLDRKKARKIRSESSEYASMKAVSFLMEFAEANPKLYPNIDELLLQFSDTKYDSVQEVIAYHAPYRILCAFVGFESKRAKKILEERMQNGK